MKSDGRLTIRLIPESKRKQLKQKAKKENSSVNKLVNVAVDMLLKQKQNKI